MVKVLRSVVTGALEPYIAAFVEDLLRQGYTRSGAEQHVCFLAHLDRWMTSEGIGLDGLTSPVLERYLAQRRAAGYVNYRTAKALKPVLIFLAPLGVLPVEREVPAGPVEALLEEFRTYLAGERGLRPQVAAGYVCWVRPFVATRLIDNGVDVAGITAGDVFEFVTDRCPSRSVASAKMIICALRSFLRWAHVTGRMPRPLAAVVPSVAGWRLSSLPKALEPADLARLLSACDRDTITGRRDYAVMLLLSRLGLRSGEVARLGLDDIDWRAGEITIQGKGNRAERLPLPADVGEVLTGYLQHGRQAAADCRTVFARVRAPHRALTPAGVTQIVGDAAKRAGLGTIHAHRLRHTAATEMLRAGGALPEVGQVLRHRSILSTAIYAKVDSDALAVLVRPWPTGTTGGA